MVNHKFQIGDTVEIVNANCQYTHTNSGNGRDQLLRELIKFPNANKTDAGVRVKALCSNGTTGYVVGVDPKPRHCDLAVVVKYLNPKTSTFHVIVIGERGLKKLGSTVKAPTTPKQLRRSDLIELIKKGQHDGLTNGTGGKQQAERAEKILEEYLENL